MNITAMVLLIAYFAILLYVGLRNNKTENSEDYFLAGRSLSKWVLAFTFVASWYGGSSCIVSTDEAFKSGLGSYWVVSGPNVIAPFLLMIFAAWIRNTGVISQVQIMDTRYDKKVGAVTTFIVIWYMITWAASQMIAMGQFFSTYLGFSYVVAIIFGVIIITIFSVLGGFKAVVITDNVQFFILLIGMIILTVVGVNVAGGFGGMSAALAKRSAVNGVQYFNLFESFGKNFMYVISFGLGWVISGDAWQRICAARTPKDSKSLLLIGGLIFIPLGCLSLVSGLAGAAIWDKVPQGGVLAAIAKNYTNPWIGAIIFLGVGAAIMSTMDTAINTAAMYMTEDVYHKFINQKASDKRLVRMGMITTVIATALAFIIAIRLPNILWVLWMSSDILMCAVFCPILMGFIWRRGTAQGAFASMIGGSAFVLYNTIVDLGLKLPTFWPGWPYRLLYGLAIAIILYFGVSLLTEPEYDKADEFIAKSRGVIKVNQETITQGE